MKLPSFPRKALECDLDLYEGGELGEQLLGLDVLHKFMLVFLKLFKWTFYILKSFYTNSTYKL